jgi:hypothetical protein
MVGGRLAGIGHNWVLPMFGRVERFRLMGKVYKLCRVRNPFKWTCAQYRTGYGVILTQSMLHDD